MGSVSNKNFNSILNNERGVVLVSNAMVSGLFIAVLVMFGETVSAGYQYLTLQHAMNEGLRTGAQISRTAVLTRNKIDNVARSLGVNNGISNNCAVDSAPLRRSQYVTGDKICFEFKNETDATDNKWVKINLTKKLTFSKVLSLIGASSSNRVFNMSFSGKAIVQ
jgi:hypothetical protein